MSQAALNVWGTVAGGLGTAALFHSLCSWFMSRLPSAKFPALASLMEETKDLFVEGIRDGLLTDEHDIYQCHLNLFSIIVLIGEVCGQIDDSRGWRTDIKNWYKGLSGDIGDLCDQLTMIRARLSRTQSAQRKRLAALGHSVKLAPSPASKKYLILYGQFTSPAPPPTIVPCLQNVPSGESEIESPACDTLVSEVTTTLPFPVPLRAQAQADPSAVAAPLADVLQQPSDSKCHIGSIVEEPTRTPTHYIISDADVKSLLSIHLVPYARSGGRRQRTSRRTVLLQLGRKLFGPGSTSGGRVEVVIPRGRLGGSRRKATSGEMRHIDGAYLRGSTGTLCSSEDVDLEAQVHELDCASDSDSSEWSDM